MRFASLALFLLACSASPGRSCSTDRDCEDGDNCLDGYCTSRGDGGGADGGRDAGRIPRDAQGEDVVCVAIENAGGVVRARSTRSCCRTSRGRWAPRATPSRW